MISTHAKILEECIHALPSSEMDETMLISLQALDERVAELEQQHRDDQYIIDAWIQKAQPGGEFHRHKEALKRLAKLGNEPYYGNSEGNCIAQRALGIDPTK